MLLLRHQSIIFLFNFLSPNEAAQIKAFFYSIGTSNENSMLNSSLAKDSTNVLIDIIFLLVQSIIKLNIHINSIVLHGIF